MNKMSKGGESTATDFCHYLYPNAVVTCIASVCLKLASLLAKLGPIDRKDDRLIGATDEL